MSSKTLLISINRRGNRSNPSEFSFSSLRNACNLSAESHSGGTILHFLFFLRDRPSHSGTLEAEGGLNGPYIPLMSRTRVMEKSGTMLIWSCSARKASSSGVSAGWSVLGRAHFLFLMRSTSTTHDSTVLLSAPVKNTAIGIDEKSSLGVKETLPKTGIEKLDKEERPKTALRRMKDKRLS